ncbi:NAD(P)-dependent oxidoreductase [Actinopolyspora erythraea]|uniref:NAD(P)-dependent oxidoreductase n=1 Tax=Actinopolyspora erythraea TaxID=414996 RepID=A0A099D5R7_9ACTN|nr:SDR family oxidoreductase [Actinopolyspora erythraea]ASU78728.1 NAD(P)-dependent oxidoreductase [Actinopolyspora erythraea]KGI81483.1 hypothetical protein IL38_11135 [Actinopolyspora erythraea]
MLCLVTGATGYIGGRLVPRLLADGHRVRCLARDPDKLRDVPWADQVEIVRGDVLDPDSTRAACEEVDVLYYLVHSMSGPGFAERDRRAASETSRAAGEAGVSRIVYLGGLHPPDQGELSEHLGSRTEVGQIFLAGPVPTVVLQAAVVLGSGSASFEMLRYLTERLPVMVTPRWVRNRVQPIAIRDLLHYLVRAAEIPEPLNRTFDVGGPEVLTYEQMMRRYAAVAGLPRRVMLPVEVLSPRLSSYWINIVTPVPKSIGAPLIDSLVHEAVRTEHDIDDHIAPPEQGLLGYEQAVRLALARVRAGQIDTRWSDASGSAPSDPLPSDPRWAGGSAYRDVRVRRTSAAPETVWRVIESIGGHNGWYSMPLAWAVRGWADRLVGGVGLRRGRRDARTLRTGDALDWWRVEQLDEGRLLRLRAEMRLPGRAWLELGVRPDSRARTVYRQRAVFVPRGLAGHAYWWAVAPFHGVVFGGMASNIVRRAEQLSGR